MALARYGTERGDALERWHSPKARQDELARLVRLRDSFVRQRADHLRQFKAPGEGPHKKYLDAAVGWFGERVAEIETHIEVLIAADEGFRQTAAVIAARRYNPNLRTFSQRLSEAGKPKALINARIRDAVQLSRPKLC